MIILKLTKLNKKQKNGISYLKPNKDGHKFFQDYPGGANTMQHLACFAGKA